jgi:hypothetical protein
MNKNELTNTTILYVIAITMLSAVAFVFVASTELAQNAVGQAEEVFNENATFIQEIEGGSPTATANQTGEAVQSGVNQTGEAVQSGVNQTGEAVQSGVNQTGEAAQSGVNQTGEAAQSGVNQTGEAAQSGVNQTGEAVQSGVNQTGEAVQSGVNQTGEAITNASKSNVAQNISQGAQEIGQTTAKESGDIFGSISEAFKGLFGMK